MELSRRSLLIGSGVAGAALTLSGPSLPGWAAPVTPRPVETDLDLSSVVIVAPDEPDWLAAADTLAAAIADTGVTAPEVRTPQEERFSDGWDGHVIQLGQLGNNIELARLYGMRYAMVDSWFPGAGGHWTFTLADPFGNGGVTLVIGASDVAGAEAGIAALLEELDGTTLPRQHRAALADEVTHVFPNQGVTDPDYLASQSAALQAKLDALVPSTGVETDAVKLHGILNDLRLMGEAHLLTADAGFAELHHQVMIGYADFVTAHPDEATDQLDNARNMWTNGEELIAVWAMMETTGVYTDAERSHVLDALQLTFSANALDGYLHSAADEAPRWNHEAYPALSLVAGADYFQRHHQLGVADEWHALGDRIFQGNTAVISLDEGSDYLMHLPIITMDYAMFTGQYDFLTKTLRPSADLNVLMIDNGGAMAGGGDVYPYGYSGVYSWGHSQVMYAASWLFPDPIYPVLLERARSGPFSDNRNSDLALPLHRYQVDGPDDDNVELTTPTVMAYPVEEGVYDYVTDTDPTEVEQQRTFHKMAFRSGLDLDDTTVLIDGFAGGRHNHQDANTIIGYTSHQRILLTDRDYMENTPEHHSGLVVVRDGQQPVKPQFARLDWVADVDRASISRSFLQDWNGTDWTRTVLTGDGDFHVVWDEVDFLADGDYLVKNQWQTLGVGTVDGQRYSCAQQDVTMVIDSLDDSVLQTRDRYGHFRKYYQGTIAYPYAEAETILSQVQAEQSRTAGDRLQFVSVIATGSGEGPAVSSRRLTETTWEVTLDGAEWTFITGALSGAIAADAVISMVGPDRIVVAGASSLTVGRDHLDFDEPVIWILDTASGDWQAHVVRRDHAQYDEVGSPVRPEPVGTGTTDWRPETTARLLRANHGGGGWRVGERTLPTVVDLPAGWSTVGSVSAEVTEVAHWVGAEDVVRVGVGSADGQVSVLNGNGTVAWSADVGSRVNEISHHVHGDTELIVVATEGYQVHAFDADGGVVWQTSIPDDPARREQKGNLIGVTVVRLGYVAGQDAAPSLMVGTQFRWVYRLNWSTGAIESENMHYFYGITDAIFADLDEDGVDEGAIALEYFYPSVWKDGGEHRGGVGGPGFTTVGLVERAEGRPWIVYGTKQNIVRTYEYRDAKFAEQWATDVGGQVTDMISGVIHESVGAEVVVGTTGFHLTSLTPAGELRFRTVIGDRVSSILPVAGQGYLALAEHGLAVAVDTEGGETGRWRFPEAVAGGGIVDGRALLVLADGTVVAQS